MGKLEDAEHLNDPYQTSSDPFEQDLPLRSSPDQGRATDLAAPSLPEDGQLKKSWKSIFAGFVKTGSESLSHARHQKQKISFDMLGSNSNVVKALPNNMGTQVLTPVAELNDLPVHEVVISDTGGLLEVAEAFRSNIVVLATKDLKPSEKENVDIYFVVEEKFSTSSHFYSLKQRASTGQFTLVKTYSASPGLISRIYDRQRGKFNDSAQSNDSTDGKPRTDSFALIRAAIDKRCTDIHIEIRHKDAYIRFRVDGLLNLHDQMSASDCLSMVGYIYTKMAVPNSRSDPVFNELALQSAMIRYTGGAHPVKLRYASYPALNGCDFILRVLKDTGTRISDIPTLLDLGYSERQVKELKLASHKIHGAVVMCGGTGSGKSTTIRTLVAHHPTLNKTKTISVEDPVEYEIPFTSQMSVQRSLTLTGEDPFIAYKRQLVRSDPDRVFIGEVRDTESGSVLKSMVLTGHQVFTTLHANSAFAAFERMSLPEIGIDRSTLTGKSFVTAIVFQMLFPVLCSHCKLPLSKQPERKKQMDLLKHKFGLNTDTMFAQNPRGCPHCKETGISGVTVAAEVMIPDLEILALVAKGLDIEAEILWRKRRKTGFDDPDTTGKTYFEHGLYKVYQGLIDPDYLEQVEPFELAILVKQPFDNFDPSYSPDL